MVAFELEDEVRCFNSKKSTYVVFFPVIFRRKEQLALSWTLMGTIYKNPSLVEVVCELHWELTPVAIPPVGGIDPFFDVVRADLTPKLSEAGYVQSQELIPSQVPRQFLAWKPIVRFAPADDSWPKIQLGPGLFTVNMSGSLYKGWDDFKPIVDEAINALLRSFPTPDRFLRLKSLQLRYVNVFTAQHGFKTHAQFTSEYLGLSPVFSDAFIERTGASRDIIGTNSQTRLPTAEPQGSDIVIQVAEGQVNQISGCLLQLSIEKNNATNVDDIIPWFNGAHNAAFSAFLSLASEGLINLMQPDEIK